MGLYDSVRVSYPGVIPGHYQTKDLDCEMDHYELGADGSLVSVEQFGAETQERIPFTGTGEVRFYSDRGAKWTEYSAYYVAGRLIHTGLAICCALWAVLHAIEKRPRALVRKP
jgi:hypothetical protein